MSKLAEHHCCTNPRAGIELRIANDIRQLHEGCSVLWQSMQRTQTDSDGSHTRRTV